MGEESRRVDAGLVDEYRVGRVSGREMTTERLKTESKAELSLALYSSIGLIMKQPHPSLLHYQCHRYFQAIHSTMSTQQLEHIHCQLSGRFRSQETGEVLLFKALFLQQVQAGLLLTEVVHSSERRFEPDLQVRVVAQS